MKVSKKNAIRAYKVFNPDWTCRDFVYKVGETYKHTGEVVPCVSGFHACENLQNCFNYYKFDPLNKVAVVYLWGVVKLEGDKYVASHIHIFNELSWEKALQLVNTGLYNTGLGNSGDYNSGDCNSRNHNSGNYNSGNYNSGDYNSGDYNSGDCNSRNHNSGNYNSGYRNSGNYNSGDYNSGDYNSGYRNSGNYNSGDYNSGDHNSGCFNTKTHRFFFDKPVSDSLSKVIFPDFLMFPLCTFIREDQMTDAEKENHPEYKTTSGYLKQMYYKEAFRKSFLNAKEQPDWQEELRKLKALPNFNADIFYEISGIRPEELV